MFCNHFKPKAGAYVAKNEAKLAKAKSALDNPTFEPRPDTNEFS
jgi:hypothetical protein